MKTVLLRCFLLFSLTGLLICCNSDAKSTIENIIRFDSLSVEKTVHLFDVDTNPRGSLQISFIYPVDYVNKDILKLIQQQFVSDFFGDAYQNLTPEDAAEKYTENFVNTFLKTEKEFKIEIENHEMEVNELWFANEESVTNMIVFNRFGLLSFVACNDYYHGGAHGVRNWVNRVIDMKTGRNITENEIFVDDYQESLAKIIIDAIALTNNIEIAELEDIGFFDLDEIGPNNNFYADETGITYTFNEYDIAAYVVGAVTVQIPYEKIRHLLRRESPLSDLAFR